MNYLSIDTTATDENGSPITFALGVDGVLSVTFRPQDKSGGDWTTYSLTDAAQGLTGRVFGVSQNSSGDIYLALAAAPDLNSKTRLFTTAALPRSAQDAAWSNVKGSWVGLQLNPAPEHITEILVNAPEDMTETPLIVIGTSERASKVPLYLRVTSQVAASNLVPFPELANPDELIDIVAGRTGYDENLEADRKAYGARGVYVLYRRGNNMVLEFDGIPDVEYNMPVTVTLPTPDGAMQLESKRGNSRFTDLYVTGNGSFAFMHENQTGAIATKISDDGLLPARISTRSSLTQDYRKTGSSSDLEPVPVYRTSISFPPGTAIADIWASTETEVEVNGVKHTIDPVMPVRVTIPAGRKLSVSLTAAKFHCPTLTVNTNLMRPEQRHWIFPDVELHKKIVGLPEDALYDARAQLGLSDEYSKEDVSHVQKAVQSLSQSIQYTYNRRPHGVHHDRALLPANMDNSHFMLDFSSGKPQYRALDKQQVEAETAGATPIGARAGQDVLDDIEKFFKNAGTIIIHTLDAAGHDILDSFEHVGKDVVTTVDLLGEDLVHGDLWKFGSDLIQGGENVGRDLISGAANVLGDVVSGAGQLLAITLKVAGELFQFIVHNTGPVGDFIGWFFEKVGAGLAEALDWFLDKIGWGEVLLTHDVLKDVFNHQIDGMKAMLERLKVAVDSEFAQVEQDFAALCDTALLALGERKSIEQPSPHPALSSCIEQTEWMTSRMSGRDRSALNEEVDEGDKTLFQCGFTDDLMSQFFKTVDAKFGGGSALDKEFNQALKEISQLFANGLPTPEDFVVGCLKIARSIGLLVLEGANALVDIVIEMAEAAFDLFKQLINAPIQLPFISDLYAMISKGRQLSIVSCAALLLATPLTLINNAMGGRPLSLQPQGAAAALPSHGDVALSWGKAYGSLRILQSVASSISDIILACEGAEQQAVEKALGGRGNLGVAPPEELGKRFAWRYDRMRGVGRGALEGRPFGLNLSGSAVTVDIVLRSLDILFGGFELVSLTPTGNLGFGLGEFPKIGLDTNSSDSGDKQKAPQYWGSVYWILATSEYAVSSVLSLITMSVAGVAVSGDQVQGIFKTRMPFSIFNDLQLLFTGLFSIANTAIGSALDIADRAKMADLKKSYFVLNDQSDGNSDYVSVRSTIGAPSWQTWQTAIPATPATQLTWTEKDSNGKDTDKYYQPLPAFLKLDADPQLTIVKYLKWAEQGGMDQPRDLGDALHVKRLWGIERKGFANVIGAMQGLGKFFSFSALLIESGGLSGIGTVGFDLLGGLGEGITQLVRTEANELY